jgi:hypothetical protein
MAAGVALLAGYWFDPSIAHCTTKPLTCKGHALRGASAANGGSSSRRENHPRCGQDPDDPSGPLTSSCARVAHRWIAQGHLYRPACPPVEHIRHRPDPSLACSLISCSAMPG